MKAERKYWFAYSVVKERWLIMDWGRWSYPVSWKGSVFTLGMILLPIVILLASLDYISHWSEWALAAFVLTVAGGTTMIGVLVMRMLTDPKLTIEDYRAAKARGDG